MGQINELTLKTYTSPSDFPTSGPALSYSDGILQVQDASSAITLGAVGNRVVLIGDSITSLNVDAQKQIQANGWWTPAETFSFGKLGLVGILATGGLKPREIIAAWDEDLQKIKADYAVILAGTNTSFAFDLAGRIGELEDLWRWAQSHGLKIIAGTLPIDAGTSTRWNAVARQLNDYIRSQASLGRVYLWEIAQVVTALSGTAWRSGFSADNRHPKDIGNFYIGKSLAKTINQIPVNPKISKSNSFIDPMVLTHNPGFYAVGNTNAIVGANITAGTGGVPNGWTAQTSNAAVTATVGTASNPDLSAEENEVIFSSCVFGLANNRVELYKSYDVKTVWASGATKNLGDFIITPWMMFKAINLATGTTGSTAPSPTTWPTQVGDTYTDGTVTWLAMPRLEPGMIIQQSVDVKMISQSLGVSPSMGFYQDDATQTGTGRPTILDGVRESTSTSATVVSPTLLVSSILFPSWPTEYTTLRSSRIVLRHGTNKDIGWLRQYFRIIGENGATCSFSLKNFEMRIIG